LAAILFSNYLYAAEAQKPRIVEVFPLDYPADAKKLGHQGTVVVEVKILTNDTISTPVIKKSSRSPILDQAAITTIQQTKFAHGTDNDGNPIDTTVAIPVDFRKDSSADLNEKYCDDFVVDYQWFIQTFPELKPSNMTVYKLTLGLLVMQKNSTDEKLKLAKDYDKTFQKTYTDCESNRLLKFMPTLLGNLK
jgi:protein TonB